MSCGADWQTRQVPMIAMRAAELTPAVGRQVLWMLDVLDNGVGQYHSEEPSS